MKIFGIKLDRTLAGGAALAALLVSGVAHAEANTSREVARVSEHVVPSSPDAPRIEVVRQRTPGKKGVRFEIEPFVVVAGSPAVFELIALGEEPRVIERCVALASSRECWDGARRVAYGPGDRGIMLRIGAARAEAARARPSTPRESEPVQLADSSR
jgi:hypothetical protein